MKRVICIIVAVIGALLAASAIMMKTKDAASIGIIGGADGPTAVFLAGKIGDGFALGLGLLGIVLILAGIVIGKVFKKK